MVVGTDVGLTKLVEVVEICEVDVEPFWGRTDGAVEHASASVAPTPAASLRKSRRRIRG